MVKPGKSMTLGREKSTCATKPLSPTLGPRAATHGRVPARPKSALSRLITDNGAAQAADSFNESAMSGISATSSVERDGDSWRKEEVGEEGRTEFTSTPKYSLDASGGGGGVNGETRRTPDAPKYLPEMDGCEAASMEVAQYAGHPPGGASDRGRSRGRADAATGSRPPSPAPKCTAPLAHEMPARIRIRRERPAIQAPLRPTPLHAPVDSATAAPPVHIPTIPYQRKPSLIESRRVAATNGADGCRRDAAVAPPLPPMPPMPPTRSADNIGSYNAATRRTNNDADTADTAADDGAYNPGNVRSLVRDYQKCVQHGGTEPATAAATAVTPPRRPMSAGPLPQRSPPGRTVAPTGPERSPRRTLPATPDHPPGLPRPHSSELKANAIWYEYGCL